MKIIINRSGAFNLKNMCKYLCGVALLVLLTLCISACGATEKEEVKEEVQPSSEENATTKEIDTVNGKITIPTSPKRIVVDAYLPDLLLLGVQPVGATDRDLENVHIQDLIKGIESTGESSPEKVFELEPDLIISANNDPEVYEKLSKIAPTIIIPYETYRDMHEEVRAFGEIVGKEQEAEDWLKQFDEHVQKYREEVQAVISDDDTFSLLGLYGKDSYAYGDGIYRGGIAIYQQLQLSPPDRVQKELIDVGETFKQISFEVLSDYAGTYIFFDVSLGGELDKNDPTFKTIDAVKEDRIFYLDPDFFWPYDPIAVQAQVQKVAEMIIQMKSKEK